MKKICKKCGAVYNPTPTCLFKRPYLHQFCSIRCYNEELESLKIINEIIENKEVLSKKERKTKIIESEIKETDTIKRVPKFKKKIDLEDSEEKEHNE